MDKNNREQVIATLNDAFRRTGIGGKLVMTSAISTLESEALREVLQKVRTFDSFTRKNDPYGEHDSGLFRHAGEKIFWKIDYYDLDMKFHSPDSADPKVTVRVLTVMFDEEY